MRLVGCGVLASLLVSLPFTASATIPVARVRGPDFDGDGHADLAVSATYANRGDDIDEVHLLWGGATGLGSPSDRLAVISDDDLPGTASGNTVSPFELAWGDFDGDCIDDLVIGEPCDDYDLDSSGLLCTGVVTVVPGTPRGLALDDALQFDGASIGFLPWPQDALGLTLAVGDFDGDLIDDLAMGASQAYLDEDTQMGVVVVAFGGPSGLDPRDLQIVTDDTPQPSPILQAFAREIAAGDFDCDGHDDLAIQDIGDVRVHYGSSSGVGGPGGTASTSLAHADLGIDSPASLASGNFDGEVDASPLGFRACADLAVGDHSGTVAIAYGLPSDAADPGLQVSTVPPTVIDGPAGFGRALSIGRFDGNAYDDLAIAFEGGARVHLGSDDGLLEDEFLDVALWPLPAGMPSTVGFGDFSDDGRGDLVVGHPELAPASCVGGECGGFVVADFGQAGASISIDSITDWNADDLTEASLVDTWRMGARVTAGRSRFEPGCPSDPIVP